MFFTLEDFRKIEEYLKLNSKKDTDFENLDAENVTQDDSVVVVHNLLNRRVNIYDLLSSDLTGFLAKWRKLLDAKIVELEELIAAFLIEKVGLTNEFGDSLIAAISQRSLTEAFNKVWGKLEEITGESLKGFSLIVTPEYYIGEDGCTMHISASSAETAGRFEYIKFYINNILITEAEDVENLEYTTTVNETCEVKCVAKILGIEYTETKILTHYSSFFLGASTSYTNIMNVAHVISINNGMKGNYSVPCNDGDHIYVVIGKSLREGFARADMNGVEIQFTESEVTVGGKKYVVFTSKGTIERGTYNIDINS